MFSFSDKKLYFFEFSITSHPDTFNRQYSCFKRRNDMIEAIGNDFNEEVRCWTKKDLIELLSDDVDNIKYAPENLRAERDIAKILLKENAVYLKYLPESLRDDKEFLVDNLRAPVWVDNKFFEYISPKLLSDKDFVIKMIQKAPSLYKYIPRKLKRDKDIYLLAVHHLAQADKQLRTDQDLNLQKLLNGTSRYSSYSNDIHPKLKSNKEFVYKALEKGVKIRFYDLHSELRKDRDIVMWYLKKGISNPDSDDYYVGQIKQELKFDSELLELYIANHPHLLPKYSFGKNFISILKKLKVDGWDKIAYLEFLQKNLLSDRNIVLDAIKENADNFWFGGNYRFDEECIDLAIKKQKISDLFYHPYKSIKDIKASKIDENLAIKFIKINPKVIYDLPKRLLSKKKIALEIAKNLGFEACHVLPKGSIDKDIFMTCAKVKKYYWRPDLSAWNHLINNDVEVLIEAAKFKLEYFSSLPGHLLDNKSFILNMFSDPKVIERLNQGNYWGSCLKHLTNKLRNEKEIVSLFTESKDLRYWSKKFCKEKKLLLKVLKSSGWDSEFDEFIHPKLRDDLAFMKEAVKLSGGNLFHASKRLKDNKSLVNLALERKGHALKFASDRLKNNKTIVLKAFNKTPSSFKHASKELRTNIKFLKKTFNSEPLGIFHYCHCSLRKQPDIYIPAIKKLSSSVLRFSPNVILNLKTSEFNKYERNEMYKNFIRKAKFKDIFLEATAKSKILKEPQGILEIKSKLGIAQ